MGEMQDIINRIKERRIELDMSYQDLSDKTGISKSTLQRYETGFIKNLSIDKLEILAKALRVSPGYLMGWEEEKETSEIYTLAAHHDGDEWTEEELQSIEDFKNFIKNKRNNKK